MVVAVIIILVVVAVECVGKSDLNFNAGIIISVDGCHLTVMSVEIGVRDGQIEMVKSRKGVSESIVI